MEVESLGIDNFADLHEVFVAFTECSNDGFWFIDFEKPDYQYMSPRLKEILGYEDHELENKPEIWQTHIHPDDLPVALENFNKHLEDPSHPYYQKVRYFHKKGHVIWVICRGVAIRDENGKPKYMTGIHTDITDLKITERKLEDASRTKDLFLASMSHEIRTPMNGILGLLQILDKSDLPSKQKHIVDSLITSAKSLSILLGDILEFSKLNVQGISLHQTPFNIKRATREIFDASIVTIGDKDIQANLRILKGIPKEVNGDKERIMQIFGNVLSNAIKYTDSGTIDVRLSGKKKDDCCEILFRVRDTGIGIDKVYTEKIFEPYFRVEQSQAQGTGLGLNICQKLCAAMDGKIWCKSELGVGTTFYVSIVLSLPQKPTKKKKEQKVVIRPSYKIAVAEDNAINQEVLKGFLSFVGIDSFDLAHNGKEIVDMALAKDYDLILMDDKMPIMTGLEAAQVIKTSKPSTPIVAITANAMYGDKERYLEHMDDYISKPLMLDAFQNCLSRHIGS